MRVPLNIGPGLFGDDTDFSTSGRWADGSNVRFRLGRAEVIGGWESLMTEVLSGVCRTAFAWTQRNAVLNLAFGRHNGLDVWQGGELFDITPFGPPASLGANPLATVNLSTTVTVTHVAHGYTTGNVLKVYGAAATNGIAAANLNGLRTITVTGVDAYTFTAGAADAASATATGGGSAIVVSLQAALPAGAANGTGTAGYGTGAYGVGPYGQTTDQQEYFPRTWSLGAWGTYLLASPRGGALYEWQNDTAVRAEVVPTAPHQITQILVAPLNGGYQAFALGCNEETSGVFNPLCIRHSDIRDNTQWTTLATGSTAREYILTGGGQIVGGRMCGAYMLVWTSYALFVGTYLGDLAQPWRFDQVAEHCGLIGPNAVTIRGQAAFWISPDKQIFTYVIGGAPIPVECPIWSDFAENLSASQGDKIVASTIGQFSEVRFDYPDKRDGYENSRYIAVCLSGQDAGAWHRGIMARSAFVDAGPSLFPVGVTPDGYAYYHERGNSADGASFAWFIRTAANYLDPDWVVLVKGLWPDFRDQAGPVTASFTASFTPQGEQETETADPMAPGDAKADILLTGRLFDVTFSGESAPTACRLGSPVFDLERCGKY